MTDPRTAAPDWLVAACAHPNFPGGGEGRTIANILWPSIEAEIARLRRIEERLDAALAAVEALPTWDKRTVPGGFHVNRAAVIAILRAALETKEQPKDGQP